jgi:hypothetical protein
MASESLLLWGLVFSSIGLGFFVYGKKQQRLVPFVCGRALLICPYVVGSVPLLIVTGMVLIAIPYFVRL